MCDLHQVDGAKIEGADDMVVAPQTMHRRDIVRGLWAGTMMLGVGGAAGCATADDFFAPSDAQLIPMALEAWEQTKQETPISRDPRANRILQSVGPKIASAANRPDDAWEFVVFDSDQKNAFVLPGGKVGFYKGLLDFSDNEDQVAAVLGHEVGHVTRRHAARRMGRAQTAQLGMAVGAVAVGLSELSNDQKNMAVALLGAGTTVGVILPFSRQNEMEADIVGVDYMHTAGYDVRESVRLWEKMGAESENRQAEWMSTHPSPNTRVKELKAYINSRGYALM